MVSTHSTPSNFSSYDEQTYFLDRTFNYNNAEFKNKKIAEYFNAKLFLLALDLGFNSYTKKKIEDYKMVFSNSKWTYLTIVPQKLTAIEKIGNGSKAPNFEMINLQGERISLDSYKGKTLYINIWSPGCSPSIDELMNLNKIYDKFKENNKIVFLNICLDLDLSELDFYIKSKPIDGDNLIPANAKDFMQAYFINVTPRYILIDKDGKIITAFAKRPSDNTLTQEIEDLLNK